MELHLQIQIPPNITITPDSPHRARSGESVRLECNAQGEPIPTVSWTRLQTGREIEYDFFQLSFYIFSEKLELIR